MIACEYKVLEYAESELVVSGLAFAVVLRIPERREGCLRGFVVSDWAAKVSDDVPFVRSFLEDVERYSRAADSLATAFFERLEGLRSGAIRLAGSGRGMVNDSSMLMLDEDPGVKSLSGAGFAGLLGALSAGALR